VFKLHGVKILGVDCPAIGGVIEEANDVAGDKNVLDAALIAAAQAVAHYEMTRYGTLVAWAKLLGRADCASLLEQNLEEEKAADSKLTALAESNVNRNKSGGAGRCAAADLPPAGKRVEHSKPLIARNRQEGGTLPG
jgi:ferritin-like metal-binding protein YciE